VCYGDHGGVDSPMFVGERALGNVTPVLVLLLGVNYAELSCSDKAGTRGRRKDGVYCELQTEG